MFDDSTDSVADSKQEAVYLHVYYRLLYVKLSDKYCTLSTKHNRLQWKSLFDLTKHFTSPGLFFSLYLNTETTATLTQVYEFFFF